MDTTFTTQFERSLAQFCAPERLRAVEAGDAAMAARIWEQVDALGFTDALVHTDYGGAGLALDDAGELLIAAGRAGLPHPFGETMVARGLLAVAGFHGAAGTRPVAMSVGSSDAAGRLICRDGSGAGLCGTVLLEFAGEWLLLPCEKATMEPGYVRASASATLSWPAGLMPLARFVSGGACAALCAIVHAAQMAGTMERVLAMTVGYASERRQFGKPIAQFQAIQQELAVMAEQAASAAMGARMAFSTHIAKPDALLAATAKMRACEAAAIVAPIAHAVYGAIGVTEELVLGVYSARLHELRGANPTARACAETLGRAVMASNQAITAFTISKLAPVP